MADTTPAGTATDDPLPAATSRSPVRWRFVVLGALCVGAIAWLVFGALRDNIVYLRPVSEAVETRADTGDRRFRMGGAVVPCTIEETADGVRFEITEGGSVATVRHRGDPPDLFEDGAPVVVEGRWRGDTFESQRLLIRHGEEYTPETVETDDAACAPETSP
ncbi:MAG TPA: cytochrome c maturation protein CcmE [Acidimicrobiia bacterium]|nr:cytochrome c maturation protein CcmE [Acidimicrobiia bacterium]